MAYMYTPTDGTLADSFALNGPVWIGMQGVVDTLTQPQWVWPYAWYESSFDIFSLAGSWVAGIRHVHGNPYEFSIP